MVRDIDRNLRLYIVLIGVANRTDLFGASCQSTVIPCNAASRPIVIDKDQPIKSSGSLSRDEIFEAFGLYRRVCEHLKMVFAHGPTLVGPG